MAHPPVEHLNLREHLQLPYDSPISSMWTEANLLKEKLGVSRFKSIKPMRVMNPNPSVIYAII